MLEAILAATTANNTKRTRMTFLEEEDSLRHVKGSRGSRAKGDNLASTSCRSEDRKRHFLDRCKVLIVVREAANSRIRESKEVVTCTFRRSSEIGGCRFSQKHLCAHARAGA